jgi:hypothetical protein
MRRWKAVATMVSALVLSGTAGTRALAQASAIPSAQVPGTESAAAESQKGHELLTQMVAALGGDAWLHRQDMVLSGRLATFYKGQPHEGSPGFEEYYRFQPFAERVILLSQFGIFIATDHRDVAEVFTPDAGYEITYKGKRPLPKKDVEDFQRRRAHSLEAIVHDWMQRPNLLVTYEGVDMVERRLADRVSLLTDDDQNATIALDIHTHLPLSITFQWHDPVYQDVNTDMIEYEDYHRIDGVQTPYTITNLHNGDMTSQRFVQTAAYNTHLPPDLFDPDRPLMKKVK